MRDGTGGTATGAVLSRVEVVVAVGVKDEGPSGVYNIHVITTTRARARAHTNTRARASGRSLYLAVFVYTHARAIQGVPARLYLWKTMCTPLIKSL